MFVMFSIVSLERLMGLNRYEAGAILSFEVAHYLNENRRGEKIH